MENYSVVRCNLDEHGQAILDLFNDAILNSTALYDYKPRDLSSMKTWFETKAAGNFPVIGLTDESGELVAFGSFGTFRSWPAYKYTAEHAIYVHKDFRGQGLADLLIVELVESAKSRNLHALIGAIDSTNQASISLHEKHGFKLVGTLPEVGFKFGRWLDVAFYQLLLSTPAEPNED